MAPIKFTYLDLPARGDPTRLALAIAGVDFEDCRVGMDVLPTLKPSPETPFASLPVLQLDGEAYAESSALLRYAGKLGGLYPDCGKAAMKVDMVVDAVETPLAKAIAAAFAADPKDAKAKVMAEVIPRYLGAIEKMYAASKGPYLLGEKLSIADLKVHVVFQTLTDGGMLAIAPLEAFKDYPHLQAASKSVSMNDKVVAWYAKASK